MIGDIQTYSQYVEGYILNESGSPLNGVSVFLIWIPDNKQLTNPFLEDTNSYSAWTDKDPENIAVVFKKSGYQTLTIPLLQLVDNPDVTMKKGSDGAIIEPWMIPVVVGVAFALLKKKKKKGKVGKIERGDVITIFLIVGGMIAFNLITKILEMFGLGGDGKVKDQQQDPNSAFKPTYWQQFDTYTYAITQSQADSYAQTIHNAFTVFQDDYNTIMGVFSQMRTKANVSFLAYRFQIKYGEDLLSFLTDGGGVLPWDGLSTKHINTIIDMVSRLPTH